MRSVILIVLLLAVFSSAAVAADLVVFRDGRTLRVASWEADGEDALLALEGGGSITVPLSRIAKVERISADPAAAPEPASAAPPGSPPERWRSAAGEYADEIERAAKAHDLDPVLLAAVAEVESNFDPFAVSDKGACGILQLMPETGERFGVEDLFDVEQNIDGGARYLRWLLDRFEGDTDLALAAYNAGENAVDRYGGIPPYDETRDYVARIRDRTR
jgi:soluble lytic murein transglycosylase-like protein